MIHTEARRAITGAAVTLALGLVLGACTCTSSSSSSDTKHEPPPVRGAAVKAPPRQKTPPGVVEIEEPTDFGGPHRGLNALRGNVYFIPPGTGSLLDPAKLFPVAVLYTSRLDVAPRSWRAGFPGVPGGRVEWFEIEYRGDLVTAQRGSYEFELLSDDGAKLYIDERVIINNDGQHPPKSARGTVTLAPGKHRIRVDYFQGPRYEIALQLHVTPPGGARQILDLSRVL
ncbi:Alpha-1,2-mannosidase [Minicystis rosea]|nr:Alpha-1,2-mannosidase [Minicystis rosea]